MQAIHTNLNLRNSMKDTASAITYLLEKISVKYDLKISDKLFETLYFPEFIQ